jgi:hypothetical protein
MVVPYRSIKSVGAERKAAAEVLGTNLVRKIIESHLIDGKPEAGEPIAIKIDQTLTQDATGTMAPGGV